VTASSADQEPLSAAYGWTLFRMGQSKERAIAAVSDVRLGRPPASANYSCRRRICRMEAALSLGIERRCSMTSSTTTMDVYLTGLRNQHAVETQAIGTVKNELDRMKPYPDLHARMQEEMQRSTTQAARLDDLLAKHGTKASLAKEAVAGTVATVAGFAHMTAGDEVLKNVLAAVGFKAYEIGSYKVLVTLAEAAGATQDIAVLEQSMREEQEMGDWLGSHLPGFVHAYLKQRAA